jgi:hypothetical protein
MNFTQNQINTIVAEARDAAHQAATNYFHTVLRGQDQYACGFAWVDICGVKGNTRLGRMLKAAGVERSDYKKCFSIWNPSGLPLQNVDVKEAGASAAARVFEKYGFTAYAGSRLD